MTVLFLDPAEIDDMSFISEDESVLVDVVPAGFGLDANEDDIRLYTVLVYARYAWERVGTPETRQFIYERRKEANRYNLPWAEASAYARSLVREPVDGGGV